MRLDAEWQQIVKKAWSFRLVLLAAVLSGLEIVLPYMVDKFPNGVFIMLSFVVTVAALIARVIAQPKMDNSDV